MRTFNSNDVTVVIGKDNLREIEAAMDFLMDAKCEIVSDMEKYRDRIKSAEGRGGEQDNTGNEVPVSHDNSEI